MDMRDYPLMAKFDFRLDHFLSILELCPCLLYLETGGMGISLKVKWSVP